MDEHIVNLRKKTEEDNVPLWIKIFGSSVLSITFLCVITLTGYIVSNLNNIQIQINVLNSEMINKKDFNDRIKDLFDGIKSEVDGIARLKERINAVEQTSKERQLIIDKYEVKINDQNKVIEVANKEIAAHKERSNANEMQILQIREEFKQTQKDLQLLRERFVLIENNKKKE